VNDPRESDPQNAKRLELVREFVCDSSRDTELMRSLVPRLTAGDDAAWTQLGTLAHNIAAGAAVRTLPVLGACARELEMLAGELPPGNSPDAFLMQCISGAIETVALEVATLQSEA
jgi:hypothetical protein